MPRTYYVECYSDWPSPGKKYRTHKNVDGDNRDRLSAGMYWVAAVQSDNARGAIRQAKMGGGRDYYGNRPKFERPVRLWPTHWAGGNRSDPINRIAISDATGKVLFYMEHHGGGDGNEKYPVEADYALAKELVAFLNREEIGTGGVK